MAVLPRSPYKLGLILLAFGVSPHTLCALSSLAVEAHHLFPSFPFCWQVSLHTILTITHSGYAATTHLKRLIGAGGSSSSASYNAGAGDSSQWDAAGAGGNGTRGGRGKRANAAFVLLGKFSLHPFGWCRELQGVKRRVDGRGRGRRETTTISSIWTKRHQRPAQSHTALARGRERSRSLLGRRDISAATTACDRKTKEAVSSTSRARSSTHWFSPFSNQSNGLGP